MPAGEDGMCILYTTETIAPALNLTLTPYKSADHHPAAVRKIPGFGGASKIPVLASRVDVWVMVTLPMARIWPGLHPIRSRFEPRLTA